MRGDDKRRACVVTGDALLFRKLELELLGVCECVMCDGRIDGADVYLLDIDSGLSPDGAWLTMSRRDECDIPLPFTLGSVRARLSDGDGERLTVREADGVVTLGGVSARLTEVEMALFLALYRRGGESVGREELIREVWGDEVGEGILNVYVHYLRSKLERGGARVIIAERGVGYRINEEYLGGEV